jgi:hypothetical protein
MNYNGMQLNLTIYFLYNFCVSGHYQMFCLTFRSKIPIFMLKWNKDPTPISNAASRYKKLKSIKESRSEQYIAAGPSQQIQSYFLALSGLMTIFSFFPDFYVFSSSTRGRG